MFTAAAFCQLIQHAALLKDKLLVTTLYIWSYKLEMFKKKNVILASDLCICKLMMLLLFVCLFLFISLFLVSAILAK